MLFYIKIIIEDVRQIEQRNFTKFIKIMKVEEFDDEKTSTVGCQRLP